MNNFHILSLPQWCSSLIMIALYFCLIISGILCYFIVKRDMQKIYFTGLVVLISVNCYLLSKLVQYQRISLVFIMIFFIFHVFYLICGIQKVKRQEQNKINRNSIKESADTLPVGLCFSRSNGQPYLVNQRMNELSYHFRGRILQNAESFWEDLKNENFISGVKNISSQKIPAVLLEDGTVWVFHRQQIKISGKDVIELTAMDSTRLYELSKELKNENKELKYTNQRLSDYEANVEELSKAQERLSMKIRIHDAIGQNLITTKYFLLQGEASNDLEKIIERWKDAIAMLKQEISGKEVITDSMKYLINAAQSAGVQVIIEGRVPKDKKILEMVMAAGAEALTNLVRHTKIRTLKIIFEQKTHSQKITFSNDENQISSIQEGGGLSSLRKRVEMTGGQMKIRMDDKFSLEIEVPQTERGDRL